MKNKLAPLFLLALMSISPTYSLQRGAGYWTTPADEGLQPDSTITTKIDPEYEKLCDDLEIAEQFVHEQLQAINFPNFENVAVRGSESSYAAQSYGNNHAILVPLEELLVVIAEYKNEEKFRTDEHFTQWYTEKCTRDPVYQKLYESGIEAIKNKSWVYEIALIKDLIRQQDAENYYAAQGAIDHEATHILQRHPGYTTSILCATILSVLCKIDQNVFHVNTYSRKILYTLQGAALAALLATRYLDRQYEWQADEGIRNDISTLRATANWFDNQQRAWFSKKINPYANYFFNCLLLPFLTHPTSAARAKRLRQRADALAESTIRVISAT